MGVTVRFRKGAWWVYVYQDGREIPRRIGDKSTAEKVAKATREALARGDWALPAAAPVQVDTLKTYSEDWLQTMTGSLKASTISFYRSNCTDYIWPLLGTRGVSSLKRRDCRDVIKSLRAKGLRRRTIKGIMATLSTILTQAVDDELLPGNPALRLGKYLKAGDENERSIIDPLSEIETTILLAVAQARYPEWYPWLLCALRTGLRLGELIALQWGDVDWAGRYLQIQRNVYNGTTSTPKNHQQRRVDMSLQLLEALRGWRSREQARWLEAGQPFPDWVFPSVTGTLLDPANVRKALNRMLRVADLHERGPHQLRHSFASQLLQKGADLAYVTHQLGHKDANVTLQYYIHYLPSADGQKAVDRLDTLTLLERENVLAEERGGGSDRTPAGPREESADLRDLLSRLNGVVSREGIEPSTRRLRVCCSAN